MPFFDENENWENFATHTPNQGNTHPFWLEYRYQYIESLAEAEKGNLSFFDSFLEIGDYSEKNSQNAETIQSGIFDGNRSFSPAANRSALFIMLYRGYPMLQLPFQLLNSLLEIDEQLSSWRYRHMNMVHRMIGTRIGTGGSTGKDYLKAAADKHYIFLDIARLNSLLIERKKLPSLPPEVEKRLGFISG